VFGLIFKREREGRRREQNLSYTQFLLPPIGGIWKGEERSLIKFY
jgi:hypothetical protein